VFNLATQLPGEADSPTAASRWTLDDLAAAIVNEAHSRRMSRSTIARVLDDADLKPHRSVYWLNSHDPQFDAKALDICRLYLAAPQLYAQGRLVVCCDEKTGMQMLQRRHPTLPVEPGKPERREHDYIRHGTRVLFASFAVPTGQVAWTLQTTRTSVDFAAHLADAVKALPKMDGYDWVLDNLNTHWSLDACRQVAQWCDVAFEPHRLKHGWQRKAFLSDPTHKHVFHFTPTHGSWLNQVELWFSVVERQLLQRGDFHGHEDFERKLTRFLNDYNDNHAHPYRWTYAGVPLTRGTPFSQTRRQAQRGRAWFSPRPQSFSRFLYPPRPYNRKKIA
jgi:hypothetical protein